MSALEQIAPATPTPVPTPPPRTPKLNRRQKAAIIVRVLLAEGAELSLADLPDDLQQNLTRDMGALGLVGRETISDVIEEFLSEIDSVGMSFPRGLEGALDLLGNTLSPAAAKRLRKQAGPGAAGDPWLQIKEAKPEALLPILNGESIEVAAVILSKLPVEMAAGILGDIPGERARRITVAVSRTEAVAPQAVRAIGFAILDQLEQVPERAFEAPPTDRIGEILNMAQSDTRDALLGGIEEDDADLAAAVRKAIFTFANIATRIAPGDIPTIIRDVDRADLVRAIAGASTEEEKASADHILSNMSQRLAGQIRDEVDESPSPSAAELEAAQSGVVSVIRRLQAAGEITYVVAEEE